MVRGCGRLKWVSGLCGIRLTSWSINHLYRRLVPLGTGEDPFSHYFMIAAWVTDGKFPGYWKRSQSNPAKIVCIPILVTVWRRQLTTITRVPPNVQFEVDDIESDWTYKSPFDFIHARYLATSIRDWPRLFRQIFELVAQM